MEKLMQFLEQSNLIEGIVIPSMDQKCEEAHVVGRFLKKESITIDDLKDLVYYLQPDARLRDGESCSVNVRLGKYVPPIAGPWIKTRLIEILAEMYDAKGNAREAYKLHIKYELLHAFSDCNGRSGRILLYWMMEGNFGPYDFLTWWYIQTMRNS